MTTLTETEVKRWLKNSADCGWTLDAGKVRSTRDGTAIVEVPIPNQRFALQKFVLDLISALDEHYTHVENLLVLEEWYLGSDEFNQVAWNTCELMRRAYGETRSIEAAPAQLFRFDESVTARAFLLQVVLNQWRAFLLPSPLSYVVSVKGDIARFYLSDEVAADEVRKQMKQWLSDKTTIQKDPAYSSIS